MKKIVVFLLLILILISCRKTGNKRMEINLNGSWEIAKTSSLAEFPQSFDAKIPVPGLVDMANPKIDTQDTSYDNSIYWYKKTFTLADLKAGVIQLKINKANYHTWVYLNGKLVGENVYNFTPSVLNMKPFLNDGKKKNDLVIAVGCRNNLPDTVTNGFDFEKIKYIPGIYDDVKLTLSDYPFISYIQSVPDIKNKQLHVVAEIQTGGHITNNDISYVIREAVSKKVIAKGSSAMDSKVEKGLTKIDFVVKMDGCRLWTPEDPFLYDLELNTSGDNTTTRFGMRTFYANKSDGVFMLNEKPYYMRGTNVCIFRFFEDPDRDGLPWDTKWIATLHNRFKEMHLNSIRYCIGFPPERWYEIADSVGFLIQDEYPVWTGGKGGFEKILRGVNAKQLSREYLEWMRERWNHPCVAVWDAQNESVNDTTAKAILLARKSDLSNRPWDNGWAAPASDQDAIESHPYLFSRYMGGNKPRKDGYLKELLSQPQVPGNDPNANSPAADGKPYKNPVIINEYDWLWLNRNGSTTTLTDNVYANVFPEADTPDKRFEVFAKNLGMVTEYWRIHRKAGAVMYFCGLGYSRSEKPRGQTSDNFIDIKNLVFEPHFYKYLKPAFSAVVLMADFWEKSVKTGQQLNIPVHIINDTYEVFEDSVKLTLQYGNEIVKKQSVFISLNALQKKIIGIPVSIPNTRGKCRLEAEIVYKGESVKSIRDFIIE
jgi:beta-galactosidase